MPLNNLYNIYYILLATIFEYINPESNYKAQIVYRFDLNVITIHFFLDIFMI